MELIFFASLIYGIFWLAFVMTVVQFMTRQRNANIRMIASLEGIERELKQLNASAEAGTKMQGDLNRAAQWFVDQAIADTGFRKPDREES